MRGGELNTCMVLFVPLCVQVLVSLLSFVIWPYKNGRHELVASVYGMLKYAE